MPEITITYLSTTPAERRAIDPIKLLIEGRQLTVRQLIEQAVKEQSRACRDTRSPDTGAPLKSASATTAPTTVDIDAEIERALSGFANREFLILVGDHRCLTLDETIRIELGAPVQFIQMIPLVGG